MIFRLLLVAVGIIASFFGVRQVSLCTKDLLALRRKVDSPYQTIKLDAVVSQGEVRLKFGAATQPIVSLVILGDRKIALLNLPKSGTTAIIRRTPSLDSRVQQEAGESIPVFEVIDGIVFHFFARYVIGLFLVLFGMLFFVSAKAYHALP